MLLHWVIGVFNSSFVTRIGLSRAEFKATPHTIYSVSQKKSPPAVFLHYFPNGWGFLDQILHAYYALLSTLGCQFLFNYLQLSQSYAILSATTYSSNRQNARIQAYAKVVDSFVDRCL